MKLERDSPPTLPARRDGDATSGRLRRWAIILGGGEGERLQPLTRFIAGDTRPTQFCTLFNRQSLLMQTLERVRPSVPARQTVVSVTVHHYRFYRKEHDLWAAQRIVQPMDKGTAPPVVHGLLSIAQLDKQAVVAILPSDHYYADEHGFSSALDRAFEAAATHSESVVVMGARAEFTEAECGWITLGEPAGGAGLYHVSSFLKKLPQNIAELMPEALALGNTCVIVGRVQALLAKVRATVPKLIEQLSRAALWNCEEAHVDRAVYEGISECSFSHDVVAADPSHLLAVQPMDDIGWSDLGDPQRVISAARKNGVEPTWLKGWCDLRPRS